ncbi:hypothetical protein OJAV_G00159750 [Oryzias javanicus]|uniref:Uncharacterized protein n=1 Tax=Oryzias javanicus TaxID=123683 RepID=A0A437CJK0_ORYJA|nr:hypothetical protein OJAV_G00159750 [Oryzias javanicus]
MHPQRPLPQAMPSSSLGQRLRDMTAGLGQGKNVLGGSFAYGFIQSLLSRGALFRQWKKHNCTFQHIIKGYESVTLLLEELP